MRITLYGLFGVCLQPLRSDQYTCTVFHLSGPWALIVFSRLLTKGSQLESEADAPPKRGCKQGESCGSTKGLNLFLQ